MLDDSSSPINIGGLRTFNTDNPFGRTFLIVNDDELEGHLTYYSFPFDQETKADSQHLFSKSSGSVQMDRDSNEGLRSEI